MTEEEKRTERGEIQGEGGGISLNEKNPSSYKAHVKTVHLKYIFIDGAC